jgi:probable F420-dependent oxidoreductase
VKQVKVGLVIQNNGPSAVENVHRLPAAVEALGYASLWFTDHVIGVRAYQPVYGPTWVEALTALAFAAACTSRIRLGVGVLVVPYRQPVYTAKVLATIDQLSGGRLVVGIGVGWSRSEYRALGVGDRYEERGAYTDEALAVMQRCWQGGWFGFAGRWTQFREIEFSPVPVQQPHPPLWVGGMSRPALRRAARFGDAWHPTGISAEEVARLGDELDRLAGRPVPRTVRIRVEPAMGPEELRALLNRYAEARVSEAVVDIKTEDTMEFLRAAERLSSFAELL